MISRFSTRLALKINTGVLHTGEILQNRLEQPVRRRHVVKLRRWGPRASSADQIGQSTCPGHQPPPSSSNELSWASSCLNAGVCLALTGFGVVLGQHLVQLSLSLCSDNFCDFVSGQSVLVTCILA